MWAVGGVDVATKENVELITWEKIFNYDLNNYKKLYCGLFNCICNCMCLNNISSIE